MTMLAYVSCAGSGEVDVLAIDERTGELALRQRVELGGMLMPMFIARGGRHLILALRSVRKKVGSSWRLQTMTLSQQLGQEAAKDLKKLRFPELHETIDWVQNLQKWFHCHVSMASI